MVEILAVNKEREVINRRLISKLDPYFSGNQNIELNDMKVSGVILMDGKLSGMMNMCRWGHGVVETR